MKYIFLLGQQSAAVSNICRRGIINQIVNVLCSAMTHLIVSNAIVTGTDQWYGNCVQTTRMLYFDTTTQTMPWTIDV